VNYKYGNLWGGWSSYEVNGSYGAGLWKFIRKGWGKLGWLLWKFIL
jgi:hypothetical protein